ncbi:MAG: LPS export ABC transporter permease LptG [Deltaproteobacteria bacterium]|nr:LPS export ABC transporter permease LptG [Deltaproteobacteria bacterium]MBW2049083.1 LPS export ABC transporter permease LptG [Deltaproteobacteria bacterium]MBW2354734.1 LPS export ABC transporter permease LptG [Deltaproteobacteria bacterium]HDZ89924.1 LPS export ABC transporter permease LptG [Deltaproteobacteria bacterium]
MGVLARYFIREFFKLLIIFQTVFIAIYLMIDFASGIDDFIKAGSPGSVMFAYFAYKVPSIAVQILPAATLTTVIVMFSLMQKNNEIISLKACGATVWKISQPIVIATMFLSVGLFLFSEVIVPITSSKANDIWRIDVKKERQASFHGRNHIWHKGKNSIYWIKQFNNVKKIMVEPTFYFFDSSFHLIRRIDARSARWKNGVWQVREGISQDLDRDGTYKMTRFKGLDLRLPERPEDFVRVEREPEEMGYEQLRRFAERLRDEGYDATRYFVDINIKIAFPFVILIMALLGIPVALWKRQVSTPVAVSLGIVLCFAYLLVLGLSRTLGFAGILPPLVSAWLANGIFFFVGIYLMINVNR